MAEKNVSINIIDPSLAFRNGVISNKRGPSNVQKLVRKSSNALKVVEVNKNEPRSKSKEKALIYSNQIINTEEKDSDLSYIIENIKVVKKGGEKQKVANISSATLLDKLSKTNYVPLSSVLSNLPSSRDDLAINNNSKPLINNRLDHIEFLENKHQLLTKMANKFTKD